MMKQSCRKILQRLVFLITIVFTNLVNAQTLPVQVTPQLIPPHSVKISDYATITNEKLFVNILLTDVNEVGRRVRLKMYIEGQGLSIATLDNVAGAAPIFLDGGINLRLTNLDLQPYFQFNNLTGISPQQYNNPLPNGGYNYCFEVYDYFTGRRISQKSCTTVFLLQNDPPILNLPTRDNIVTATNPQNILFTWTPRHSNLNDVQYEFTLKELWDTQNPQANFLGSIPFYQTTTRSTTLLVGPEAPQLISGKVYGWQVRAFVSDGINETSVFKNNGGSEIFWFKYLEDCRPPSFVLSQALTAESVKIEWQLSDHIKYNIQYRKKGFGDDDWFDVNSYTNEGTIFNLEPDTVYEFRVGGECTPLSGYAYSNIQEFTTPSNDEAAYYNCGITPEINIDNQELLPSLKINETFTAGDFPVTPREVSGSNGTFSGWGYITLPFLENLKEIIDAANILTSGEVNIGKYTRIKVEFENVKINTNKQLIEGVVKTTYDPKWGGILDADEIINDILGDDGNISTYDATNMDIDDVIINDNGDIVIIRDTKNDGPNEEFLDDEIVVVSNLPVVITDQNGDQWTVDEEGNITKGEGAEGGQATSSNTNGVSGSGNVNEISSKDVSVKFIPSGFYGTDEYNTKITSSSYKSEYEFIETHDYKEYSVLYKLISDKPESTDIIEAEVTFANGKTKKDIVFKTKQGGKVDTTWVGNKVTLKLKKQFDFGKDEIIATVKPKEEDGKYEVAGKLNTWHVKQREINLTLVSVNNTPLTGIKERINAIYNKAGVNFNISEKSVSIGLDKLSVGDSDMLSNYTDDEKSVIQSFKDQNGTEKEQYYMFFFNDIELSKDLDGFMPLKRQFGFVFKKQDAGEIAAHELGHGIFGLKHPWDQYNDEDSKSKTDYLMDYGGGTKFSHMDWQKLHAPGIQLYWFQDDEAGEQIGDNLLASRFIESLKTYIVGSNIAINEVNASSKPNHDNSIKVLDEVIVSVSYIENDVEIRAEEITTTDGDTFNMYLKVDKRTFDISKEKDNFINYGPVIDSFRENQFTSVDGTDIRLFHSYEDKPLSDADKEKLKGVFLASPSAKGIMLVMPKKDFPIFKKTILDFENDVNAQTNWLNTLNQSVKSRDYDKLQKYPAEAFKILSRESRVSLFQDVVKSELSSSSNAWRRFWGGADEEIVLLSLLQSIISDQTKDDNSALKSFIQNEHYKEVFQNIDDNDIWAKLYETIGHWTSKADQKVLYDLLFEEFQDGKIKDYKLDLLISILVGTDKYKKEETKANIIELINYNHAWTKNLYKKMNNLQKEYFVNYLTKWATTYYGDNYNESKRAYEICDTQGCLYQGIDQSTSSKQWFERENFSLKYIGYFDECGETINSKCHLLNQTYIKDEINPNKHSFYFTHEVRFYSNENQNIIVKPVYYKLGSPLSTFVNIHILEDYNYANLKKGSVYTVPLIWANHFAEKHNDKLDGVGLDLALRTVALVATVASAGTASPITIGFLVALEGGGILLTLNENELRGAWGNETFNDVQKAYTTVELIVGGATIANSIRKLNFKAIADKIKSMDDPLKLKQLKDGLVVIHSNIKKLLQNGASLDFKNLDYKEFLRLIKEIDLRQSFFKFSNDVSVKINKEFKAFIISGGIEYSIATGKYLDNLNYKNLLLTPTSNTAIVTNVATDAVRVGTFDNVYIRHENLVKNKSIGIYKTSDGKILLKLFDERDDIKRLLDYVEDKYRTTLKSDLLQSEELIKLFDDFGYIDIWKKLFKFEDSRKDITLLKRLRSENGRMIDDIENINQAFLDSKIKHLDLGGLDRYPGAIRITGAEVDYADNIIDNHILTEIVFGDPKTGYISYLDDVVDRSSIDLITVESAMINDYLYQNVEKVLKADGKFIIEVPGQGLGAAEYERIAGIIKGGVTKNEKIVRETLEYTRVTITKGVQSSVGGNLANSLNKYPDLVKKVESLGELKTRFLSDFADATEETIKKIGQNPNLVDSWKIIKESPEFSKNIDDVKVVDDFIQKDPNRIQELEEAFNFAGDKRKFLDDLIKKKQGDIIGNKVDGVYLSNAEKKFLPKYLSAGHQGLTEIEQIRKFRNLKSITSEVANLLRRTDVNFDILRLEKLVSKSGNDLTKLDVFWQVVNSNNEKFVRFVDYLDLFKKNSVDLNIKPNYFNNAANEFKDINITHILDKHTMEFFDFNNPQNFGTTVDMFLPGISQRKVMDYIDEALSKLSANPNKGSHFPIDGNAEKVLLGDGLEVIIGARSLPDGRRIIGQFYPVSGTDMITFSQRELLAFKKILN